jgi:hypothetical protein
MDFSKGGHETDQRMDSLGFFFVGTVFVEGQILFRVGGAFEPWRGKE